MKVSDMVTNRFGSPSVLTDDTQVLGLTAAEWQKQLTGGFRRTFDELENHEKLHGVPMLVKL